MELQHMRYVVAVAEEGSFTRAAERCFVVQSALSHQINALEREIGVRLFARSSRRVEVTAAGQAFIVAARESLAAAERAIADAAEAAGTVRGELRIGVIPTVAAVDLPELLARFHAQHPDVRISLQSGGSNEFIADIKSGRLHAAFMGLPDSEVPVELAHRKLSAERLVAVIPASHRLAGRRSVKLCDLQDETFVDFPSGSAGREQTDEAFRKAGLARTVSFEAMSVEHFSGFIQQGLGVALLSSRVVPEAASIKQVTVTDGPHRSEYLAWNDFNPSPATTAFVRLVEPLVAG
ncbi:LysR family transcriptional regulator [Corynebacterium sp. CCUG 65737]|uniref:LysR family transcriptional regulator n=1 Tax=unclassified Corynebacterium TaxID=2624378 RepID=UPI00210910F6|nr:MULTISPECIES: LysR family transcriptional regulator [unclassified Corynebacterium]MCQ4617952.1 LysR family transcriptional regulator [Corynebacterium pseudogenitalium]MCQ4624815.1 LysR family transcriptional regulator [Corynebacterium sp. CCUG 69979]MCQ4626711.1 LysR family transcriptional regulator [Corynebacterium sp. CCUG 65737]